MMSSNVDGDYKDLTIFQRPVRLLSSAENGSFVVEEDVLGEIRQINKSMVVISITGRYLTGKSVLMNTLAEQADFTRGFTVSHTSSGTTKGIWAFCKMNPMNNNQVSLFLDTEGLGKTEKNEEYDGKLFAQVVFLSSVILYNEISSDIMEIVEKMTYMSYLRQYLNDKDFATSPSFVLCLRDKTCKYDSETNNEVASMDELLANLFQQKADRSDGFIQQIIELKAHFSDRKCFAFDRPAKKRKMREPPLLKLTDLSEQFRADAGKLMAYICNCKPKQLLNGDAVNGLAFTKLIKAFVDDLNNGKRTSVAESHMTVHALEKGFQSQTLDAKLQKMRIPLRTYGMDRFSKQSAQKQCHTELQILFDKNIVKKKDNKEYEKHKEGFLKYKADISSLKREYRRKTEKIDTSIAVEVLHEFLEHEEHYETLLALQLNKKECCKQMEAASTSRKLPVDTRALEISELDQQFLGNRQYEQPNEKDLSQIAAQIGSEYRHLGFELGLNKPRIDQICLQHSQIVDRTTDILLEWKNRNSNKATFAELHKALKVVGSDTDHVFRKIMKK